MTTEKLEERGIRTANLKIDLYNRLTLIKINRGGGSISSLVEELLDFYEKKVGKK